MEELREASKIYLEKRIMEPPSLAGSVAGSVIDPDINIEEEIGSLRMKIEEKWIRYKPISKAEIGLH